MNMPLGTIPLNFMLSVASANDQPLIMFILFAVCKMSHNASPPYAYF